MRPIINLLIIFFCLLFSLGTNGQSVYKQEVQSYLTNLKEEKALLPQLDFVISDIVDDRHTGLVHVYVQHTLESLPIIGSISGFHFDIDTKLKYTALRLPDPDNILQKKTKKVKKVEDVLAITAKILGLTSNFKLEKEKRSDSGNNVYRIPDLSSEKIFLREALLQQDEFLIPVWEVGIYDDLLEKWQVLHLDVSTGFEINRDSWTKECFKHDHIEIQRKSSPVLPASLNEYSSTCDSSYKVFAYPLTAPNEGVQSIVSTPWDQAPIASPNGWHDTTFLRGNNAYAFEDLNADNSFGYTTDGGEHLCFDSTFNESLSTIENLDVSLTNVFYWNNLIHDVMYNYGFDEVAGNFQDSNYNRGGAQLDRVIVDILDGSGQNNANFSTPPDGFSARMQMFEWLPDVGNEIIINEPDSAGQNYDMLPALFGPNNITITDTIVQSNPDNACDSILNANAISGKIALLNRGDCSFVLKALEVQKAGAIAMIVCNTDSVGIFRMGGNNFDSVIIPSIMMNKADCDSLKIILDTQILEATITIPPTLDSGLDNGIVTHEYAHGISTRLTGGPSSASCLTGNEQMGEGWSDWYALMFTLDASDLSEDPKGVGSYVLGQESNGNGIRNFPYSPDLLINPVTYNDIKSFSVPHGVGSVWASMLWDMTWNLIDQHGFDSDIYNGIGGNNIAMELVTLGLKLQPCDPGFVDGRDAILVADEILYNGANACFIWKAFARRGLGRYATQGSSISSTDGTENYDMPTLCNLPIYYSNTTNGIAYSNDSLPFYFDIRTNSASIDTATINGELTDEILYYSGTYTSLINDTITFKEMGIDSNTFIRKRVEVIVAPSDSSEIYYLEKAERMPLTWQIQSDTGSQSWEISDSMPYRDSLSFFCQNVEGNQTQLLISPEFIIEGPTILGFWHYFNLEKNWDGGFIELTKDNGQTWIDLGEDAISNGYNETLKQSSNPFSEGRLAYSGTNQEYQQTIIDLSPYSGESIQIRFVLASDRFAFEEGWYIDNISLYHKYEIDLFSELLADNSILRDTMTIVIFPSCEPCDKDLCDSIISSITILDSDIYKAFQYIESDASLNPTDNIKFSAGDSILLKSNFTVPQQAVFQAIIEKCIER